MKTKIKSFISFRKLVFGLLFGLCCVFAIFSNNLIGIKANENTEEIPGEEEIVENEENTEEEVENNTEEPVVEEETTQEEQTEEPIEEELEEGFLEENWKLIVSSLMGTTGGIGALLYFVLKAIKSAKSVSDSLAANGEIDTKTKNILSNASKKFEEADKKLTELISKFEEKQNEAEDKLNKIYEDNKAELDSLMNAFIDLAEAFKIMVNNSDELVKKGVSNRINKIIDKKDE